MTSRLFSPLALRGLALDNRIVVSPMAQYSADDGGHAGHWHLVHIGQFAVSGPGLIIMEAAAVQSCGRITRGDLGLWNDDLIALGRGMMYDPRWAWHAAEAMGEQAQFPPQYARSHPSMRHRAR